MSLRTRLLVGLVAVALVLGGVTTWVFHTTRVNLLTQVDDQLERAVPRLRDSGRLGNPPPDDELRGTSNLWAGVIVNGELRTLVEPGLTDTQAPPDLDVARVEAQAGQPPFTVGSVGADTRFRVRVQAQGPLGRTVVYALPLDDVDATLRRLLVVELGGSAIILAVLGLVMFWVVRLGVRPIKEMTTVAQAIGQGDLSHRIPDSTPGTEAGELGGALNDMLSRIEDAFRQRAESEDRLRRFVGDASHELRTPITTIRGYAELYGSGGLQDPDDLDQAMRRTQQEATRMGRLVEDLLHLARLDQGRPLEPVALDAAALLADAARDLGAVDPGRPVQVQVSGPLPLVADDSQLRQVVANLVANARTHTAPDTPITLRGRLEPDTVLLEVRDEGPGMTPAVATHAFERFYRADPARARATGGSGLGLSIVASIVAAHHGTVGLDSAPGRGTTAWVRLPRGTAPPPHP